MLTIVGKITGQPDACIRLLCAADMQKGSEIVGAFFALRPPDFEDLLAVVRGSTGGRRM